MRRLHLIFASVFLLLFVASGLYMKNVLPPFNNELDGVRMIYRASHLYLLFATLLNLLAGAYWQTLGNKLCSQIQVLGSTLLLCSLPVLGLAFLLEPSQHWVMRPLTMAGCWLALLGTLLHAGAGLMQPTDHQKHPA